VKKTISAIIATAALLSPTANANGYDRDALSVDKAVDNNIELKFPNDDNIYPESSDFKILNYVTMSNEYGERKVTVTLENTSSGNRIFVSDQIMALYANGTRISPHEKKISFKGKEVQTLTLNFNNSKYPILQVYTRH
jgi:hypothetical protein